MKNTNLNEVLSQEIRIIGESLIIISEALNNNEKATPQPEPQSEPIAKEEKVVATAPPKKNVEVKEQVKEEEKVTKTYTEDELNAMKYNDIKKVAKELGLSAVGAKNSIVARILESFGAKEPVETTEKADTVTNANENNDVSEEVTGDIEEDGTEDEMDEETIADKVEAELKEYSIEDIGDLLESVGISPKGKRQALIAKVVKAVEEGLISLEEEEEEEEPEQEPKKAPKKEEPQEDNEDNEDNEEDEEESEEEFLLKANTKVRKQAIKDIFDEVGEAIENDEFSDKEIDEALASFYLPHEGYSKKLPKAEKIEMLKEMYARMIDDEGETHEFEEAYYINDEPVCCGHILKYVEEDKEFVCSVCGNKYDAE